MEKYIVTIIELNSKTETELYPVSKERCTE